MQAHITGFKLYLRSIENFVLYVDSLIIYHYHLINIIIIFTISYKRTLFQKAGENPFDGLESSFGSFGLNKESDVPELPGQANQWLQLDSSPMSARARNSGQSQASQRLSSQSGVSPRVSHESSKSTQQKKQSYRDMEGVGLHSVFKIEKEGKRFVHSPSCSFEMMRLICF